MLREQVFSDISRYAKKINPEYAAQIAEHKEKVGFTDYDALGAPKRKVQRTDAQLRELEGIEKAKAEARAQAEHQAALARLVDGTAIHRQKSTKNEVLKKVRAIKTVKPAKKIANAAKKIAKPSKYVPKPKGLGFKLLNSAKKVTPLQISRLQKALVVKNRRDAMIEVLKSGGAIKPVDWRGRNLPGHQTQSNDLVVIEEKEGFSIVRVHQMNTRTLGFMIDDFERYDMPRVISCYLSSDDRKTLLEAVCSGKLITVESFHECVSACRRAMTTLSRKYGFNIHSVMRRNKTLGWILLEEEPEPKKSYAEVKRESEVNGLGDMLQAIDYLKIRREAQVRMPGASTGEIDDAAFIEYKRVQKDGQ